MAINEVHHETCYIQDRNPHLGRRRKLTGAFDIERVRGILKKPLEAGHKTTWGVIVFIRGGEQAEGCFVNIVHNHSESFDCVHLAFCEQHEVNDATVDAIACYIQGILRPARAELDGLDI